MDRTLADEILEALDDYAKTPPAERFDEKVRRGVIDKRGRVLMKNRKNAAPALTLREVYERSRRPRRPR